MDFLNDLTYQLGSIVFWDMFPYILASIVVWALIKLVHSMIF